MQITVFLLLATLTSCRTSPTDDTAPAHEILQATLLADDNNIATIDSSRHPSVQKLKDFIIETVVQLDNNGIIVKEICSSETKALGLVADDLNPDLKETSDLLRERTRLREILFEAIDVYSKYVDKEKNDLTKFRTSLNERIASLNTMHTETLRSTTNHSLDIARFGFRSLGVEEGLESTICDHVGCTCATNEQTNQFCSANQWPNKCQQIVTFYIEMNHINCENNHQFSLVKSNIVRMIDLLHQLLQSNAESRRRLQTIRPTNDKDDDERLKLVEMTTSIKTISDDIVSLCERFSDASMWTTQGYVEILSTTEMGAYHSQEALEAATTREEKESRQDEMDELEGNFHKLDESV